MDQTVPVNSKSESSPAEKPWVEVYGSRDLPDWLARQALSLAFSTYQTGKLFLVGSNADRLSVFERTFDRAMGLYGNAQTLWLGTRYQLWRFENMLPAEQFHEGHDRLYVPRIGYTTGDLDIHDIAVEDSGRVVFAATASNCLATLSPKCSFQPLWLPPFISKLATEDRCHLNGLALRDGKARYVTVVSQSDVVDGWRDRRTAGGCVIDVTSGAVLAEGLSMPHSPRWYRERLWVLNSGKGEFGWVDLAAGRFEPVAFCPGYLRGLAFAGDHAIVSLSQPRQDKTFGGLALDGELARRNADAQCGLQIIDMKTGDVAQWLKVEGMVSEIYDVVALPGALRPMALGFKTDEIQRLLIADEQGIL
ncbi:MAG: TIGR03032 family protein [Isosphaeraceae bacterium]